MFRLLCIAVATALVMSPDVYQAARVQPEQSLPEIQPGQTIPVLPAFSSGAASAQADSPGTNPVPSQASSPISIPTSSPASSQNAKQSPAAIQPAAPTAAGGSSGGVPANRKELQENSRLAIMRDVSGEFARMVSSLPGGRKGFHMKVGEAIDKYELGKAIRASGASLNTGDDVQITKVAFESREIEVDLNGGGRAGSIRDHLQYGVGIGVPIQTSTTTTPDNRAALPPKKVGATLYLDFGRTLPDMSPDELKSYLKPVLDFSNQRSASALWISTLPANVQQAIAEKRADLGMDREQILSAMGRPDRKVREEDADGNETEDWIYGYPPAKTIFVRFIGDKVVKIDTYN